RSLARGLLQLPLGRSAYGFQKLLEIGWRRGVHFDGSSIVRQLNFNSGQTFAANEVDDLLDDVHCRIGEAEPDGDGGGIESAGLLNAGGFHSTNRLDFGFERFSSLER